MTSERRRRTTLSQSSVRLDISLSGAAEVSAVEAGAAGPAMSSRPRGARRQDRHGREMVRPVRGRPGSVRGQSDHRRRQHAPETDRQL